MASSINGTATSAKKRKRRMSMVNIKDVKRKKYCDDSQSYAERRRIRDQIIKEKSSIVDNSKELIDYRKEDLREVMKRKDTLFMKVKHSSEAVEDLKLHTTIGRLVSEQARELHTSVIRLRPADLMKGLKERHHKDGIETRIDYLKVARIAMRYRQAAPTCTFMANRITAGIKSKKRGANKKHSKNTANMTQPEAFELEEENDVQRTFNRGTDLSDRIYENCAETEHVLDMYRVVMNPYSLSETVENIFDLAFVTRAGECGIEIGGGVKKENPSVKDENAKSVPLGITSKHGDSWQNEVHKRDDEKLKHQAKQFIFKMDYSIHKEIAAANGMAQEDYVPFIESRYDE